MTRKEHAQAAQGCLLDVEFQHEKLQGLLSFMVRMDDRDPPDTEDIKLGFMVLENLVGEAQTRMKQYTHHYRLSTEETEEEGGEDDGTQYK